MANQKNQDEHKKYFNSKGEEVPSCTTVLKLLAKNLEGWSNWLGRRGINYDEYMNEAASIGTEAHSLAESMIKQDDEHTVNYSIISRKDEIILRERIRYLLDKLARLGYTKLESEVSLEGERFGGTLDLLCYNEELDRYLLLDFKTSKNIYKSMYIQLAGYCQLLKEVRNIEVSHVGIILLKREVTDKDFSNIMTAKDNLNNSEIFTNLLNIYYLYGE